MTKVNWHPYPEEKPLPPKDDSGNFLVRNANFHKSGVIVAWMLCPEPYRPEAKDE